jgi:transcriptional regulator with XRE-family HTH domain
MGRRPQPVDPSLSPWHLLGATIRHWRSEVCKLTLAELAGQAYVDEGDLSKWERGITHPQPDAASRLDQVLGAAGQLTALHSLISRLKTTPTSPPKAAVLHPEEMDAVRRQLLVGMTTLAGAAAIPLDGLDNLRKVVESGLGTARVSDWEELAFEYSHSVASQPLSGVIPDLALDVLALQKLLHVGPTGPRWAHVNARLTFLLAFALGSAGYTRESRQWWMTARSAAEQAGDRTLVAAAFGYEACQALYEQRPVPVVVERVEQALAAAQGTPCSGVAEAYGALSLAAVYLGDTDRAYAALQDQARTFEQLPEEVTGDHLSVVGWPVSRLLHMKSYIYALTGHPQSEHTHQEALDAYPASRVRQIAQVQLHSALSAVRGGDVVAGLDHARQVLSGLAPHYQTRYVRYTAATVLEAVPTDAKSRSPVTEYREFLALEPDKGD